MKVEAHIKRKLKQVSFRHRQKFVRKGLSIKPCNCKYNCPVELKTPDRLHQIRTCTYFDEKVNWEKRVCDESFSGLRQAQSCPHFECKNNPEGLKKQFDKSIGLDGSKVLAQDIAKDYPDIMALYWVLGPPEGVEEGNLTTTEMAENSEFVLFMSDFLGDEI